MTSKNRTLEGKIGHYLGVWHFRMWSFQGRDTKLERILAKNQL